MFLKQFSVPLLGVQMETVPNETDSYLRNDR